VTAYTVAMILYGNGQRSGVISNLTIGEFELREEEENNKVIIPCVHHKTSQGISQLVVIANIEEVLLFYYEMIQTKLVLEPGIEVRYF